MVDPQMQQAISTIFAPFYVIAYIAAFIMGVYLLFYFIYLALMIFFGVKRGQSDKLSKINFFASKNTLKELRTLTPIQFEEFVADLFCRLGFMTKKTGRPNDGGIDVIAEKDGIRHYIQCKKFITRQVSVGDVRNFYGAMADKLNQAKGYFITTNVFTLEAEKFAEGKPLELIDGKKLMDYVKLAGGANIPEAKSEACPRCGGFLVERSGKYGKFLGCRNYPKCKFTKKI